MTLPEEVFAQLLGEALAPVAGLLAETAVTEIMINGPATVYVERAGRISRVDASFADAEDLLSAVRAIAQYVGKVVDDESPTLDARLPDGSRVHAVLAPCARGGPMVTIRKFSRDVLRVDQLLASGTLSEDAAAFLGAVVQHKRNLVVAGGTGSGKTSLLNVLSSHIDPAERILVLEDSSELQLQQPHVCYLESRPAAPSGRGAVGLRELFRSALRMRPDRILIGEVRGGEALDLIQAMTSGHAGSMSTLHATHPGDALRRLETMALMSGVEMPLFALRAQIVSAVDVLVQVERFGDGTRRVTHVAEVTDDERGGYRTTDLFKLHWLPDEHGEQTPYLHHTDVVPSFLPELRERVPGLLDSLWP